MVVAGSRTGAGSPSAGPAIRCVATELPKHEGSVAGCFERPCHRIKTRGQGAGNTSTALTRPIPNHAEGGQAVKKPRALLYATVGGLAVMSPGEHVGNLTVSVVAR